MNQICNKYDYEIVFINPKDILLEINEYYINGFEDNVLIESLKGIIAISGTVDFDGEKSY